MTQTVLDTLVTGLPLVPVFMGIYLVFRIRDDFDLTIDGTFVLGAAVVTVALGHQVPAPAAMLLAVAACAAAGLVTAAMHLVLRIPVLLAGLVMSLGLYSVNLHVMGSPTVSLGTAGTLFSAAASLPPTAGSLVTSGILAGLLAAVLGALGLFLKTEIGLALRATGVNPRMARAQGVNDKALMALSLALANALAGLGGCLTAQNQGFADVNMGTGTFVAGVGAVLLGELLLRPGRSTVTRIVLAVVAGTLGYELVLVVALREGLAASDLQGATALTLLVAVAGQRYLRPARAALVRQLSRRPRAARQATADPGMPREVA